jgi:hypothetical protein
MVGEFVDGVAVGITMREVGNNVGKDVRAREYSQLQDLSFPYDELYQDPYLLIWT